MTMKHSILISTVMLAGFAQAQQETTENANRLETLNRPATATLQPTKGNQAKGTVTFTPTDDANKVKVQVHLSDLKPGSMHGMHVHEKGDCSAPDASSAGGHFNPAGKPHGDRSVTEKHAGDLGNVEASSAGKVSATFDVDDISVSDGQQGIIGKSVILHEKADDLKTQPSGDSGDRIACAVIKFQTEKTRAPRL